MISTAAATSAKRQVFFVSIGGFDTHDGLAAIHPGLLTTVADAMDAFYQATVELGVASQVTTFTASDFGRTLTADDGSDHGWGSMHFMLGGAVNGGRFYGTPPVVANDGPDDVGQGRLLPSTVGRPVRGDARQVVRHRRQRPADGAAQPRQLRRRASAISASSRRRWTTRARAPASPRLVRASAGRATPRLRFPAVAADDRAIARRRCSAGSARCCGCTRSCRCRSLTDWIENGALPSVAGAAGSPRCCGGLVIAALVWRVRRDRRALEALARSDGLTGLLNRRSFEAAIDAECARARRTHQPLCVVYLDIDKLQGRSTTASATAPATRSCASSPRASGATIRSARRHRLSPRRRRVRAAAAVDHAGAGARRSSLACARSAPSTIRAGRSARSTSAPASSSSTRTTPPRRC